MTKVLSFAYALLFSIAVTVAAISVAITPSANAQEDQEQAQTSENQEETGEYSFVAQMGDSYTKIARKSVQIYGIDNNVNLSAEQIVFAETNLTIDAGSPDINEGQSVTISKDSVKSWVDKANELSDSQKAAWTTYTTNVDFNTNNVGE